MSRLQTSRLNYTDITARKSSKSNNRLYEYAKIREENKKLLKAKIEQERLDKEKQHTTFKPKIFTNPKMQQVRDPNARAEDYLLYRVQEKKYNLERLK